MEQKNNHSQSWFRLASLNTLEQGLMRFADAGTTFVLLWSVPSDIFGELALAQAWIAPLLFLFLSPENIIYREYSKWKTLPEKELTQKLSIYRQFGYFKAILALFISLLFFLIAPQYFWSSIWAFTLVLTPQFCGIDREYLRLSLNLKKLNYLTLIQKLSLLILVLIFPKNTSYLALAGILTAVITMITARFFVHSQLKKDCGNIGDSSLFFSLSLFSPKGMNEIKSALSSFSIWSHVNGVITNWVQTLDIFLLGYFMKNAPAALIGSFRESLQLGQYAAMLKLANFTTTLPLSLSNLFSIWINQTPQNPEKKIIRYSVSLFGIVILQGAALLLFSEPLLATLSRGRWNALDQENMTLWLAFFTLSLSLFAGSFIPSGWYMLRSSPQKVTLQVYIPWLILSGAVYFLAMASANATNTNIFTHAAVANIFVYGVLLILISVFGLRLKKINLQCSPKH